MDFHQYLRIYTFSNKAATKAIDGFYTDILKIPDKTVSDKIINTNIRVYNLISEFPFEKLFISITTNNSIFYRFKLLDSEFEFKLEVFINEDQECDFDSILHIYKNSINESSTYGSIDYIFDVITDILFGNDGVTNDFHFFEQKVA